MAYNRARNPIGPVPNVTGYTQVADKIAALLQNSDGGNFGMHFDRLKSMLHPCSEQSKEGLTRSLNKYAGMLSGTRRLCMNPPRAIWRLLVETWSMSQAQEARGGGVF